MSYRIVGAAFAVYNQLGAGYQEKYYQRALEKELVQQKIGFKREVAVPLRYRDENIGRYFLDFLVEDKVVVELKVGNATRVHLPQALGYLTALQKKLAIIVYFTRDGVLFRRVVNPRLS